MICREKCPRGTKCNPISNVVADDDSSFVCIGYHNEKKKTIHKIGLGIVLKALQTQILFLITTSTI